MKIGWIDFSKKDMDKVFEVIDKLNDDSQEAVDELGIGAIRDGFANMFFPGTSTVQTRAKYFLIVPYILRDAMNRKYGVESESILKGIDDKEKSCAKQMLRTAGPDSGHSGILGRLRIRSGGWLLRPPSRIYWSGLKTFGIIKGDVKSIWSLARDIEKHLKASDKHAVKRKRNYDDYGEKNDANGSSAQLSFDLDVELPYSQRDWAKDLDIELNVNEASFLEKRIVNTCPTSLLAYLVNNNKSAYFCNGKFSALYENLKDKDLSKDKNLSVKIKKNMQLANDFIRFMRVGFAAFNLGLVGENRECDCALKAQGIINSEWNNLKKIADKLALDEIFKSLGLNDFSGRELKPFLQTLQQRMAEKNIKKMQELCSKREIDIKGEERAKVSKAEAIKKNGLVGLETLNYRLPIAERILIDIRNAKRCSNREKK
jgi:hypothetical protein